MVPNCIGCGYDLAGLARDGRCPECGTPVERSYAPDMLENRSLEFLNSLHSGLRIVFFGMIGIICLTAVSVAAVITAQILSPGALAAIQLVATILTTALSLVILLGWWRITTPDPARVGGGLDVRPRQVLRVTLIAGLAVSVCMLALQPFVRPEQLDVTTATGALYAVLQLLSLVAWGVQFFAAMLYFRWLARRIPDPKLESDAKRFMWLGPVLFIVFYLCLLIGPLVALVLYMIMLNTLRKHVEAILIRLGAI